MLLLIAPRAFRSLAAQWYPTEFGTGAQLYQQHAKAALTLRSKFWQSVAMASAVVLFILFTAFVWKGSLTLADGDTLRIAALMLALIAAIGRGGWSIATVDSNTVIERIDRGMYMIEQLGVVSLLMLIIIL